MTQKVCRWHSEWQESFNAKLREAYLTEFKIGCLRKGWFTTAPCALNFDRYQQNFNRAESFSVLTSCRKPLSGGSHTGWLVLVWYLRRCTMMLLCGFDVCSVLHISTTLRSGSLFFYRPIVTKHLLQAKIRSNEGGATKFNGDRWVLRFCRCQFWMVVSKSISLWCDVPVILGPIGFPVTSKIAITNLNQ